MYFVLYMVATESSIGAAREVSYYCRSTLVPGRYGTPWNLLSLCSCCRFPASIRCALRIVAIHDPEKFMDQQRILLVDSSEEEISRLRAMLRTELTIDTARSRDQALRVYDKDLHQIVVADHLLADGTALE